MAVDVSFTTSFTRSWILVVRGVHDSVSLCGVIGVVLECLVFWVVVNGDVNCVEMSDTVALSIRVVFVALILFTTLILLMIFFTILLNFGLGLGFVLVFFTSLVVGGDSVTLT